MRITSVLMLALAATVSVLAASSALAQGFVNAKYAGEFLSLGVGGRYAGVGGSGVAISNDVASAYYNPAGLSSLDYPQVSLFHESRFSGLFDYDYLAGALPLDAQQTIGLSILRFGYGDIKDTRNALIDQNGNGVLDEEDRVDPSLIRIGNASDWAFIGSYARTIGDKLSVGGNVKVLHRNILDTSAWGVGIDLAARYTPIDNLTLAGTLHDATKSMLAWETGHQEFIVPSLRLGGSYDIEFLEDHTVRPTLDGIFRFEGRHESTLSDLRIGDFSIASLDLAGGLEYGYKEKFFARGGVSELQQLSLGAGVRLPKLNIDYAFTAENQDLDNIGATHRISLTLTLEEEKFLRSE